MKASSRWESNTSGLSCQCSATEPRQLDVTTGPHNLLYILTAQARGVLGSTANLFTFLLFHLITSKIHLFQA